MNRQYLIVTEKAADGSYSAYVPDLPGCAVCGQPTREEARRMIQEAIAFHIDGLVADGEPVPEPSSRGDYVEANAK